MIKIFTCHHNSTNCRMPDCRFDKIDHHLFHLSEGIASLTA